MSVSIEQVRHYLYLRYLPGLSKAEIKELILAGNSAGDIWHRYRGKLELREGEVRGEVEKELELARQKGFRIVPLGAESYPPLLKNIFDPPTVLYIKGDFSPQDDRSLAVIGTRKFSKYGRAVVKKIVPELSASGITIVSGMCRGLDTLAHQCALESGGRTLAVLGSGLDIIYPPENRDLYYKISASGAVLSEFPLGMEPRRYTFPIRNRIIAGLSLGVLVIEAPEKSGTLITVSSALEQNREVFAVPGSVFSSSSKGTNQLISEGATVVTCSQDILESLAVWRSARPEIANGQVSGFKPEDKREEEICRLLRQGEYSIDELTRRSNLSAGEVGAVISRLEIEGAVEETATGRYTLVAVLT